jgi:diguanylate cyclase (GGDEF)-like protein
MAQRQKSLVATVLIDLNNFKTINDTFGHEAGDVVLKVVARRLQASVRDSDTVARMSGDEFVLVLANQPSLRFTLRMVERLRQSFAIPVSFNGREIQVGASVGVALYPHDGITATELVRAADVAMYHGKGNGHNDVHFFSADMRSSNDAKRKIEEGLRARSRTTSCSCSTSRASRCIPAGHGLRGPAALAPSGPGRAAAGMPPAARPWPCPSEKKGPPKLPPKVCRARQRGEW